jgi:hypothetical protein
LWRRNRCGFVLRLYGSCDRTGAEKRRKKG